MAIYHVPYSFTPLPDYTHYLENISGSTSAYSAKPLQLQSSGTELKLDTKNVYEYFEPNKNHVIRIISLQCYAPGIPPSLQRIFIYVI